MSKSETQQNDETDNPHAGGHHSLATIGEVILVLAAVIISGGAIILGQSFVGHQLANPEVFDSQILSVGGTIILLIGATLFLLTATHLFLARSFSNLDLKDKTEYQLIGAGGLAGLTAAFSISVINAIVALPLPSALDTSGSSIVGAVFLGLPLGAFFYDLTHADPVTTGSETESELDPETVRERTSTWSEDADTERYESDHSYGGSVIDNLGTVKPTQGLELESKNRGVRLDETEFEWQMETDKSFADVGGMDDIKQELRIEVIKPLEEKEKAEELGVSAPNVVFHGPPGTGKTHMAEALATELGLPFAKLSGVDVQSKWINESAQLVNDLFSEAKDIAKRQGGAVVFFDELDSVLIDRSGSSSGHKEDSKVVNEFLNHLEETKEYDIVFVGATNRIDALDEAGIRSGRIDKKIHIGEPDVEARDAILRSHLEKRTHRLTSEEIRAFAKEFDEIVAADIDVAVENAAKRVLARGGDHITADDLAYGFHQV